MLITPIGLAYMRSERLGSWLSHAIAAYSYDWQLYTSLAKSIPLHAVLWVLGHMLTAQALGFYAGQKYATRSKIGSALASSGAACRTSAVAMVGALIFASFIAEPTSHQVAQLGVALASAYVLGVICGIFGCMLWAGEIARAWIDHQAAQKKISTAPILTPRKDHVKLSYLALYPAFPQLAVLLPFLGILGIVTLFIHHNPVGATAYVLIMVLIQIGVRYGMPPLIKLIIRQNPPRLRATLLRKFFAERQAKILRGVVSPSLGAYARIITLSDPSYYRGREKLALSQQEAAESIKDTLAHIDLMIDSSDKAWKPIVSEALSRSDIAVIDVTQMSSSLAWELAEALSHQPPECILLLCNLEGHITEKLRLGATIDEVLWKELTLRGESATFLAERYRRVLPPVMYADFPASLVFRIQLVRRLRDCARFLKTSIS